MTFDLEDLRHAVYRTLASTGRAPDNEALAAELRASPDDIAAGLRQLADARHLALGAEGQIVLAHPFASVDLGFSHREGPRRGYATDLATVWRLASGWYAGRLDRGYLRREPSEAHAYLRAAGLSGPFWGL